MADNDMQLTLQLQRQDFTLAADVRLPGEGVTAIFGHSGSGKTSLLRCVAGLEKPRQARIKIADQVWQQDKRFLPAHKRPVGYVFQEASLFPHLTAQQNLQFAIKRAPQPLAKNQYDHIIELLGIGHLLTSKPDSLSGGEQQRVAIARALLINPRLLLMDEPLASLDMARKQEILPYLERLKKELQLPILYVSHSTDEIARIADHILALDRGKVVANGPLLENLTRLDFPIKLGEDLGTVVDARVVERNSEWHLAKVAFQGGELWVRDGNIKLNEAVRVRVLARDVSLALSHHTDSSIQNIFAAEVAEIADDHHPAMALLRVKVADTLFIARVTRRAVKRLGLKVGDAVYIQIKSAALVR